MFEQRERNDHSRLNEGSKDQSVVRNASKGVLKGVNPDTNDKARMFWPARGRVVFG